MRRYALWWALGAVSTLGAVHGAFEDRPFSARSAGLGDAAVASAGGPDSAYENPAGLARTNQSGVSLGHTDLLGMSDMPRNTVSAVFPFPGRAAWGLYGVDFGSNVYREREAALAAGWSLDSTSAVGAAIKGQQLSVDRYGRASAWQIDVGWWGRPLPGVAAGVVVRNATQSRLRGLPEKSPAVFLAGVESDFWKGAPAFLAIRRDAGGSAEWRLGQEIFLRSTAVFRMGYRSAPARWGLGWGFVFSPWSLDYAFLTHPNLPDQHQFNFTWRGKARVRSDFP